MIKLNDDLLQELGLDALPLEEKKRMLAHIYETLEMRVGMKLAQQMTDEQLDEFEQFIKSNDEAGALHWLETKFPHYKDVVSAEFENLKLEIRQVAPQILASSAAQAQQMQTAMSSPGQPYQMSPQQPFAQQPQQQWQQPQPQGWAQSPQQPQPDYGSAGSAQAPQQFNSQQMQVPQQPQAGAPMPQQMPQQQYQQPQPGTLSPPWSSQDQQQPPMAA